MAASAKRVKQISSDSDFQKELSLLGQQLVVVDFFATGSEPCKVAAPKFEELSVKYTSVCFWNLDVARCNVREAPRRLVSVVLCMRCKNMSLWRG